MQSNLHTYQQCLSVYSIWIKSNIDQDQKDYYKECTNMVIWYDKIGVMESNLFSLKMKMIMTIY